MSEKVSERIQLVSKITSAVLGLALIIAAVYLVAIDRSDQIPTIIAVAGLVLGGMGTLGLPALFGVNKPSEPKPKRRVPPPLPILMLLGCVLVLSACSSAWDAHAFAATTLRDGAQLGNTELRERRMDELRAAAMEARATGADVGAAIDAEAARYDAEHAQLYEAQRALAATSTAYTGAVFAAMQGRAGEPAALLELGRQGALAWTAFVRAINAPELDVIPPEVLTFLTGGAR